MVSRKSRGEGDGAERLVELMRTDKVAVTKLTDAETGLTRVARNDT